MLPSTRWRCGRSSHFSHPPVLTNINVGILEALLSAEDGGEEVASADAANVLGHRLTLLETFVYDCFHTVPSDLQAGSPQSYKLCVSLPGL